MLPIAISRRSQNQFGQWYSFAQDNSDTENVEENAQIAKTAGQVRSKKSKNAWGGQKIKIWTSYQMGV